MTVRSTLWETTFETLRQDVEGLSTAALQMVRLVSASLEKQEDCNLSELQALEERADHFYDLIRRRSATLVASTSPLAKDLRIVAAALHTATDLERIADEALDLAHVTNRSQESASVSTALASMAAIVVGMVENSIAAFLGSDLRLAEAVGASDDEVDAAYLRLLYDETNAPVPPKDRATLVQMIVGAHALERIADHATNVAEWAVYLQTGEFVSLNGSNPRS
jgi:phosphate transport system protein